MVSAVLVYCAVHEVGEVIAEFYEDGFIPEDDDDEDDEFVELEFCPHGIPSCDYCSICDDEDQYDAISGAIGLCE